MDGSTPDPLSQAQNLWRGGQYGAATRQFALAAQSGQPAAIVALLRALLALAQWDEARRLVAYWRERLPGIAPLAGYQVLLQYSAGEHQLALAKAGQLSREDPFCRAVAWAMQALATDVKQVPPVPPLAAWDAAMDGMGLLLDQAQLSWQGFPAGVLEWAINAAPRGGLCVECGVYWGRSIRQLAGGRDTVHGFDSFAGLPEAWKPGEPAGAYSTGGRLPPVPQNVLLYRGWFDQTLPEFVAAQSAPLDLLHVDCDLYSSTVTVLEAFAPLIRKNTLLVFDDYLGFAGWREHEHRALADFCQQSGMQFRYAAAAILGREVAIQVTVAPRQGQS